MKRGLIIVLLMSTIVFAECPPEAVPGTCVKERLFDTPVIIEEEELIPQDANTFEQNNKELAMGVEAMRKRDYQTAFSIFKKLAEAGNFIAQQNLGVMYNEGLGTSKNKKKASYWFEKSKGKKITLSNGSLCSGKNRQTELCF